MTTTGKSSGRSAAEEQGPRNGGYPNCAVLSTLRRWVLGSALRLRLRLAGKYKGRYMTIGLGHYLTVAACLFTLGVFGIFINRKNVIVILMSIELILLAVNINLVAFSHFNNDLVGQVFALFILTVAAAEAAIGLAIIVVYYRNRGSIAVEDINMMKG